MYRKMGVLLLVVVMALSVAVASASPGSAVKVTTPDGKTIPEIADGRLNGFDIAAPVVVYYTYPEGRRRTAGRQSTIQQWLSGVECHQQ